MLNITAEIIVDFEKVRVICTRKYGNGESRLTKIYKKKELEALGDEEAQWNEINLCVTDMFNSLRKEE